MRLSFLGATRTVTGSCYLLETEGIRVLVDCGLYQGGAELEELNRRPFAFDPAEIDYVLLTHAHIDHSGLIPLLCKQGFQGKILATGGTVDLCRIMLADSGHIHEAEAEWKNRKRQRAGLDPIEPLYALDDALACRDFFVPVRYKEEISLAPNVTARFVDSGHILGSASIQVQRGGRNPVTIAFSGDLGSTGQAIIKDPTPIHEADVLLIETTYGNRTHENSQDKTRRLWKVVDETLRAGGNVIVPAFAVGRTQEIVYRLNSLVENNLLRPVSVYIDSPLAISATEIFRRHPECFDEAANRLLARGDDPLAFPGLAFTRTAEESKALNEIKAGAVIISASGMCTAGRIRHHLKHNLWRPESTVLFVGYQAHGTLGRQIQDGAEKVNIFGEEIAVKARIETISGFSAHADQPGLLQWLGGVESLEAVFLVHGEVEAAEEFAPLVEQLRGIKPVIPELGQMVELA